MSNSNFQERFKNKVGSIDSFGIPIISKSTPIIKPKSIQLHDAILKASGKSIVASYSHSTEYPDFIYRSFNSIMPQNHETIKEASSHKKKITFTEPSENNQHELLINPISKRERSSQLKYMNKSYEEKNTVSYNVNDYPSYKSQNRLVSNEPGVSHVAMNDWLKNKQVNDTRNKNEFIVFSLNDAKLPLLHLNRANGRDEKTHVIRRKYLRKNLHNNNNER